MRTALDVALGALGGALAVLVLVTVYLVVRDRPARPPSSAHRVERVRGRSLAGWQASVLREIRRAGRRR